MCTRQDLKSGKCLTTTAEERTISTHDRHVSLVSAHGSFASVYGVQIQSPMNELAYFHVTEGLPPDVAHDLLEGVCKKVMTNILPGVQVYVTDINSGLESFPYKGSDKSTKP